MQQFLHLSSPLIFTWMQVLITDYWKSVEKWWISFVIVPRWNGTKKGVLFWQEKNLSISSSVIQSLRNVVRGTYNSSFLNSFIPGSSYLVQKLPNRRKATRPGDIHGSLIIWWECRRWLDQQKACMWLRNERCWCTGN